MFAFAEIWGNETLLRYLKKTVQTQTTSHAYLLVGKHGCGKKMIADAFCRYLHCENPDVEACGGCTSCRLFDAGNHPDVIYITTEKKSIGVEEIREQILETVGLLPYSFPKKIYVIPNAHTLTPQAQNALLKTLEEPPAYALFVLLAESTEPLLQTVLSRSIVLQLPPLPDDLVAEYLQKNQLATADTAKTFAIYAQGSIGMALELLQDESFAALRDFVLEKIRQLPKMSLGDALLLAKEFENYKNDLRFLDMIELWYRDVLVAKSTKNPNHLIQQEYQADIFAATGVSTANLIACAEAVQLAKKQLSQNGNFRLTMEVMLMNIKENTKS